MVIHIDELSNIQEIRIGDIKMETPEKMEPINVTIELDIDEKNREQIDRFVEFNKLMLFSNVDANKLRDAINEKNNVWTVK